MCAICFSKKNLKDEVFFTSDHCSLISLRKSLKYEICENIKYGKPFLQRGVIMDIQEKKVLLRVQNWRRPSSSYDFHPVCLASSWPHEN